MLVFVFPQCLGASYLHASSSCCGGARIPTLTKGYPNLPTNGAGALPVKESRSVNGFARIKALPSICSFSLYLTPFNSINYDNFRKYKLISRKAYK